jgi:hypothetical protein
MVLRNKKVCVLKNLKILGLIFYSKLNWHHQTVTANQALRIISKFFSTQEKVKLSTALFYSRHNYEAKIWLSSALSATLKKNFGRHYQRYQKFVNKDSFKTLHIISGRSNPEM